MHDQSEDLGYRSFNAVVILGTIWLLTVIYCLRVGLYYAIKLYKHLKVPGNLFEGGKKVQFSDPEVNQTSSLSQTEDKEFIPSLP
jgi:hypothetical protein